MCFCRLRKHGADPFLSPFPPAGKRLCRRRKDEKVQKEAFGANFSPPPFFWQKPPSHFCTYVKQRLALSWLLLPQKKLFLGGDGFGSDSAVLLLLHKKRGDDGMHFPEKKEAKRAAMGSFTFALQAAIPARTYGNGVLNFRSGWKNGFFSF